MRRPRPLEPVLNGRKERRRLACDDQPRLLQLRGVAALRDVLTAFKAEGLPTAEAMREAVSAGRKAFLAGRMPKKLYASASSPLSGVVR